MNVISLETEVIVVSSEFDQEIDVESLPVEVSGDSNLLDVESDGNVSVFETAILSRGRTADDAFDGLSQAGDIVGESYPDVTLSEAKYINTVFNIYVDIEDDSIEDVREHLHQLEGVDEDEYVKIHEGSEQDISMSLVGLHSYEVPDGTTHRILVIGFNDGEVEDHGDYLVEHLEQL